MNNTKSNRNVICISFRESELWLYDKLRTFSCPSGTIKDILKEHFSTNISNSNGSNSSNANTITNNIGSIITYTYTNNLVTKITYKESNISTISVRIFSSVSICL